MYKTLKSPIAVNLEVTSKCNHKCIHCYNYWRENDTLDVSLSYEKMKLILRALAQHEVMHISITGGEPFIYPDIVFGIIEEAYAHGITCSINSNLTIMNAEIAQKLSDLNGFVMVSVLSFESATHDNIVRKNGAFNKTMANINILKELDVPVTANMVVMQANSAHVYKTGKFLYEQFGIKTFSATKVNPPEKCNIFQEMALSPDLVRKTLEDLLRLKSDYGLNTGNQSCYPMCFVGDLERYSDLDLRKCSAGSFHCSIGAGGEVRACLQTSKSYGNIFTESLSDIWERMHKWRDGSYIPEQCKPCHYLYVCSGGCRADSEFRNGGFDALDPYAQPENCRIIPPVHKQPKILNSCHKLTTPPLRFRDEKFGVVVSVDKKCYKFPIITHDSANFLKQIEQKEFTIDELSMQYAIEKEQLTRFLSGLAEQGMIHELNPS